MSSRNKLAATLISIGVLICLAALWVASYFCGTLPKDHWAQTPTLITGIGVFMLGIGVGMFGCLFLEDKK